MGHHHGYHNCHLEAIVRVCKGWLLPESRLESPLDLFDNGRADDFDAGLNDGLDDGFGDGL